MGGRARSNFFALNWTLSITEEELDPSIQEENARLHEEVKSLQSQVVASSHILRSIQQNTPTSKRTAKHYSKRHERRVKKRRIDECTASLSWLQEGLTPVKLIVMNSDTNEVQEVTLRKDLEQVLNLNGEHLTEEEADSLLMVLYVKDKYNVSGNAYHEMASICRQMPRHYKLKRKIAELNSLWNFKPTPEGTVGVQQPLKERLFNCLQRLVSLGWAVVCIN